MRKLSERNAKAAAAEVQRPATRAWGEAFRRVFAEDLRRYAAAKLAATEAPDDECSAGAAIDECAGLLDKTMSDALRSSLRRHAALAWMFKHGRDVTVDEAVALLWPDGDAGSR